ncbi:MAG: phosphomannomutase/phosphoglucomutase [Clostridiales bacterium]|nr:phosphomannomutase/phosphoglucomutase [Clostridiales bacterium]
MLDKYWKHFKSGTDIRGVAADGVAGEEIDLTNEAIEKMAKGFALWLKEATKKEKLTVSVGHDSRISAERIKGVVIKALCDSGIDVIDCSLSSTPAMFMTTVKLECDGAVQITASHHPFNKNGLKFFTRGGGLEGSDIEAVLQNAQDGRFVEASAKGSIKEYNFMADYANDLCEMIKKGVNAEDYEKPLKNYHIIVDAGNGAGGFYAEKVLKPLGADIKGSQFLEPDGMFPNHIPNPENAVAMDFICKATVNNKADLGVIFDTDVDRAGCVDKSGNEINRNKLVALAAAIALEGNEGGTIVTDSVTSSGLKTFIEEELGGKHLRFKRGYKNVINESIRLNKEGINSPLAIETSGHAALKENYFLDDGSYLITKIIIKMANMGKEGKTLESLIEKLKQPVESKELRMNILTEDFAEYGNNVIKKLFEYAENQEGWNVADDNHEGIRVSFGKGDGDGWFLLRLSVHDPIMPLNIESDVEGGNKIIAKKLYEFLKQFDKLKISCVEDFIK